MSIQNAILKTLAYHDVFDYPLKLEEVHCYLIGHRAAVKPIQNELLNLEKQKKIGKMDGYFHLKARTSIIETRKKRTKYAREKIKKAILFANILKVVPTIKLVALSGGLAVENSEKKDDIDLVIVTKKRSLWTTRLAANAVLIPFKRNPRSKDTKDKACLNVFIDESDLKIKPESLYIAHEVGQMKILWDRESTYSKFLKTNKWIYEYLPNWKPEKAIYAIRLTTNDKRREQSGDKTLVHNRLALVVEPLEALAKWGQLWYMRSKITSEKIGKTQLFFHPRDTENWVLSKYKKRLRKLNLRE